MGLRLCRRPAAGLERALLPTLSNLILNVFQTQSLLVEELPGPSPTRQGRTEFSTFPQERPKTTQEHPKRPQGHPKKPQEHPKSDPRATQGDPRAPQEAPRAPQEHPKSDPRRPKSTPRGPKSTPRPPQERPKATQDDPRAKCLPFRTCPPRSGVYIYIYIYSTLSTQVAGRS